MDIKITIPDEKKNDLTSKRMDNLERKLDQQYKAFMDKSDYIKVIDRLQDSFSRSLDKMLVMNRSIMTQNNNQKINLLREDFKRSINTLKARNNTDMNLKMFVNKIGLLEEAIKGISIKPSIVRVSNNNNKDLLNAFDEILKKISLIVGRSGSRLIPSPS